MLAQTTLDLIAINLPGHRREIIHDAVAPCSPERYVAEYGARYGWADLYGAADLCGRSARAAVEALREQVAASLPEGYSAEAAHYAVVDAPAEQARADLRQILRWARAQHPDHLYAGELAYEAEDWLELAEVAGTERVAIEWQSPVGPRVVAAPDADSDEVDAELPAGWVAGSSHVVAPTGRRSYPLVRRVR